MKYIKQIEKYLSDKRKALLHCLRAQNWNVVGIDDADSDWALDEKWLIESTRESKGLALALWMFKYEGLHDRINRVVSTACDAPQPGAYGGTPAIEFDIQEFERQLACFMNALHEYRTNGTFTTDDNGD